MIFGNVNFTTEVQNEVKKIIIVSIDVMGLESCPYLMVIFESIIYCLSSGCSGMTF